MEENCGHDCGSCAAACDKRTEKQHDFREKPHELSRIRRVVGVMSGKGGVGKSLVTSLLAVAMQRRGFRCGILDADITGPSIPRAFGVTEKAMATETGVFPVKSAGGIGVMSLNLLLQEDTDPVIWRGPILAGTVKQFWTEVIWGDLDFLFIDMPPGTGDVPLTVFQSIPVDGVIVVTSPQQLVSMIVAKAVRMAQMMKVPILGLVENMSYFQCPDCGSRHEIFGQSHIDEVIRQYGLRLLAQLPVDPGLARACDEGRVEQLQGDWLDAAAELLADTLS